MISLNSIKFIRNNYFFQDQTFANQIYKDGKCHYSNIKRPVSDEDIKQHLEGRATIACYPAKNNLCKFAVIDVDVNKDIEFTEEIKELAKKDAGDLAKELCSIGIKREQIYFEFSGRRGFHLWLYFDQPLTTERVHEFLDLIRKKITPADSSISRDIFPTQAKSVIGNCIKVPFGIHKMTMKKTLLIDCNGKAIDPSNDRLNKISAVEFHRAYIKIVKNQDANDNSMVRLINKCPLIHDCIDNPSKLNYETWMGIGSILAQLNEEGLKEWQDLSKRDYEKYNEKDFRSKIGEIQNMKPWGCKKLCGKQNCGVKNPLALLNRGRARAIAKARTDYVQPELIYQSMDDYRLAHKNEIDSLLTENPSAFILDRMELGCGKTHELATQLKNQERSVAWFAPNHVQSEQVINIFADEVVHLKSREQMVKDGELICAFSDKINRAIEKSLPASDLYCFNENQCGKGRECPYFIKYEEARQSKRVVLMHPHLKFETLQDLDKDIIVFDENPIAMFKSKIIIKPIDIQFSKNIVNKLKSEHKISINAALINLEKQENIQLTLSKEDLKAISKKLKLIMQRRVDSDGRWLLGDLLYLSANPDCEIKKHGDNIVYLKSAWLPADKPVWILDATQRKNNLKLILPDKDIREIGAPTEKLKQYAEVTQVIGGVYYKSTLMYNYNKDKEISESGKRIVKAIKALVGDSNVTVLGPKDFVELPEVKEAFNKTGYFGNTRGLNKYKDDEVIVIVGLWMQPINVMVEEANKQHGILKSDLSLETEIAIKDLQNKEYISTTAMNGDTYDVRKIKFTDPYVQNYFDYSVLAEFKQAIGRARIYLATEKHRRLIIISDLFLDDIHPDKVIRIDDIVEDPRKVKSHNKIKELKKHAENPNSPKILFETAKHLGVKISLPTIKRHYKDIGYTNNFTYCSFNILDISQEATRNKSLKILDRIALKIGKKKRKRYAI